MKIRYADTKDESDILQLYRELYPKLELGKISIRQFNAKPIILVAEVNQRVVGLLWATFVQYRNEKCGYIEDFVVKKEMREQGIGTGLLKAAQKKLKQMGAQVVFVITTKGNSAIKVYKSVGFEKCGRPWFYWSPQKEM